MICEALPAMRVYNKHIKSNAFVEFQIRASLVNNFSHSSE